MQDNMTTTFVMLTAIWALHIVHEIPVEVELFSASTVQVDANVCALPLYPTARPGRIVLFI
jgi:hypothetical protein